MNKIKFLNSSLLLFLVCSSVSLAQFAEYSESNFSKYEKGETFFFQKNKYFILVDLEANFTNNDEIKRNNRELANQRKLIDKKGKFNIFEKINNQIATLSTNNIYPVTLNERSGQLGVIVGNLLVSMKDMKQADKFLIKYGLESVEKYPPLNLVIFRGKYPSQVLEVFDGLSKEPSVNSVEIEVLENLQMPM